MILSCLIETVNNFRILELQDKVLCRVCFERDIAVVLIPCRHRILCRFDTLTLDIHLAVIFADSICQSRLSDTWVTSNFDCDYFVKSLLFCHHFSITFSKVFIYVCSVCSEKCKHCPVCRNIIVERMPVFDV